MKKIFLRIQHFFTGHDQNLNFISNIYGDAIEAFGGKRSVWECPSCGSSVLKDELYENQISKVAICDLPSTAENKAIYRRNNGVIYIKLNDQWHVPGKLSEDKKSWLGNGTTEKIVPNELVEVVQQ